METINGEFIMRGLAWNDPHRIKSPEELTAWVDQIGFVPLFANDVDGFSVEEHVSPRYWWTGSSAHDPWAWREIIAAQRKVAYGKFFGGKAGFISLEWLPVFANYRRQGYDFDSRWDEGLANRREKIIMDMLTERDSDGEMLFTDKEILTTDLKKLCGFGKGGEKNFPGITTKLMMQTYLTIVDFHRRKNKKGGEYGMPVSVMLPPEAVWGYEHITSRYSEDPKESWEALIGHTQVLFPQADEADIIGIIGKAP